MAIFNSYVKLPEGTWWPESSFPSGPLRGPVGQNWKVNGRSSEERAQKEPNNFDELIHNS